MLCLRSCKYALDMQDQSSHYCFNIQNVGRLPEQSCWDTPSKMTILTAKASLSLMHIRICQARWLYQGHQLLQRRPQKMLSSLWKFSCHLVWDCVGFQTQAKKGLARWKLWWQVEEQVRHFIVQNNRPFNAQVVADHLAQYGLKKGPIQKALDSLSEANKITCKVILTEVSCWGIPGDTKSDLLNLQIQIWKCCILDQSPLCNSAWMQHVYMESDSFNFIQDMKTMRSNWDP